jgi:hypothetical protein
MHPDVQRPVRRVIQIVMVLALLLSGTVLPASAMPCCTGAMAPMKASVDPAQEDAMDMSSCHHDSAEAHTTAMMQADGATVETQATTDMDCMPSLCVLRSNAQPTAFEVSDRSQDAITPVPVQIVTATLPVSANPGRSQETLHPPSPPTAMPLPLRV